MRLALALGRTLVELQDTVTPGELAFWAALAELDGPFLPQRMDVLAGIVATASANCMGGRTRPRDWIPEWGGGSAKRTLDFKTGAEIFLALMGGKKKAGVP